MKTISTEEARAAAVADIEARIAERDAEKPADKDALAVHEFGTAMLRNELHWARGVKLPYELSYTKARAMPPA